MSMKAMCIYRDEFFAGTTVVASNETPEEAKARFLHEKFEEDITDDEIKEYEYFFIMTAVANRLDIDEDYSGIDEESLGRSLQMIAVCRAFEVEG